MPYPENSFSAQDIKYNLHPFTNLSLHEQQGPLIITRGEGVYVYDEQGNRYLEGLSALWCAGLGFSEPRLVAAATEQLNQLPYMHTFAHRSTEPVIELAARLIEVAPGELSKAYFVNSGSEAVDTAIKLVWYYFNAKGQTQKKKLISRNRSYHGVTIAGGSLTRLPYVQDGFDLPVNDRYFYVTTPNFYRYGEPGETETEFVARLAAELEELILREGPETVAAFVAEPVMGAGGVVPPAQGYFRAVQEVLRRHDVLMVADEVICGFGRTGRMWGCETYAIEADILTCAKQMSSAYLPIGAVLLTDKIYQGLRTGSDQLGVFGTGNTYGGHPVAAAVAVETLKIYQERDIVGEVQRKAPHFLARLQALSGHPLVGEARGVGLIGGLEIVADKVGRQQFPKQKKAAAVVAANTLKQGVMVRPLPSDTLGICPPLIISEDQIDELFDGIEAGLNQSVQELGL